MASVGRDKYRYHRDMCLALDIVHLARRRYLVPGWHEGPMELLGEPGSGRGPRIGIRAFVDQDRGVLTLDWPVVGQEIEVIRSDTPVGPRWSFRCPGTYLTADDRMVRCDRPARRLLAPMTMAGLPSHWGCRVCLRVAYRDEPRDVAREARESLEVIRSLRADLDRLERYHRANLADLRGLRGG